MKIVFSGKVMRYPGLGGWHFIYLPEKGSARIGKVKTTKKKSWGYQRVRATIGETSWNTTLWPKANEGVYLLVIKIPVLKREKIGEGDTVRATVILDKLTYA